MSKKQNLLWEQFQRFKSHIITALELFGEDYSKLDSYLDGPTNSIEVQGENFLLKTKFESELFSHFLKFDKRKSLYHYTSLNALENILITKKLRLSCIIGMNDRSEIIYADQALGIKKFDSDISVQRLSYANRRFILSLSTLEDDLNSWRLYGNDGRGACLKIKINADYSRSNFKSTDQIGYHRVGKMIYRKDIIEHLKEGFLSLNSHLKKPLHETSPVQKFYLWRNFFKQEDYKNEEEVRVLFNPKKEEIKWSLNVYNFPNSYIDLPYDTRTSISNNLLKLESVTLGPKIPEVDIALFQWEQFTNVHKNKVKFLKSNIKHYR